MKDETGVLITSSRNSGDQQPKAPVPSITGMVDEDTDSGWFCLFAFRMPFPTSLLSILKISNLGYYYDLNIFQKNNNLQVEGEVLPDPLVLLQYVDGSPLKYPDVLGIYVKGKIVNIFPQTGMTDPLSNVSTANLFFPIIIPNDIMINLAGLRDVGWVRSILGSRTGRRPKQINVIVIALELVLCLLVIAFLGIEGLKVLSRFIPLAGTLYAFMKNNNNEKIVQQDLDDISELIRDKFAQQSAANRAIIEAILSGFTSGDSDHTDIISYLLQIISEIGSKLRIL